jgi:hypothetical protein
VPVDEDEIPAEKIETYRAVCRLERQGATEGERASAKAARERMDLKYPGIAEAAGKAADAEQGPVRGRGPAPAGIDWSAIWAFAKANFGTMQAWLDSIAADAEQEAEINDILDDLDVEVKATKKAVVWRITMDVEDFQDLGEACGSDMDGPAWKSAAKRFGEICEEAFLATFENTEDEK